MNNLLFLDRYSTFVFLIIFFQYFHSFSLGSHRLEFLVQLIPYFLMLDIFTKPLKLKKLFKKKFLPLILFNGFCFLSLFWTDSIKYTLASNFELLQTSLTIILVFSYIENNKYGMENITKFSLYAIYLLLFLGAFSFNYENRTILGISPSLSSSIFNYGSICSLYLYHKTKKKYQLFSLILLFVLNFGFSSLRGIFSIFIGSLAYLKVFNSKNNINFYLKVFLTVLVIIIIYILIVMNSNIVIHTPYFSKNKFIFVHQFLKNSHSLKYTITDIFVNKNFNFSDYEYVGERISAIFIGIKETLINSPLIGFGHCNTAGIFESYGKQTYSHNGIIEIFMGTGIVGLFLYLKFLVSEILKPVKTLNDNLINWKRFSSLVFIVHLFLGLSFENIPLSLLLALIISV